MLFEIAQYMLILNGIFDLICSTCLITIQTGPHMKLYFPQSENKIPIRFLAYWILTYGIVRLCCGIFWDQSESVVILAVATYVIEAACFEYELHVDQTMSRLNVRCITGLCVFCIFLITQKTKIYI